MDIVKKIKDRIEFNEQSRINLDFGMETDGVIESENKFLNELLSICASSLQLNERLKTSFEDYKNQHFIEMENYYLNRYNAEHLSLEQIIDKYLDD